MTPLLNKGMTMNCSVLLIFCNVTGSDLAGAKYSHPVTNEPMPFLPAKHVNTDIGTGLVHTAPAHGMEDFLVALENKIPVVSNFYFSFVIKRF